MTKPVYKVKVAFGDGQDNGYQYKVGDEYPRYGYTPTDDRIAELIGKNNARGTEIIEVVAVIQVEEPKAEPEKVVKKSKKQWN